MANGAPTHGAPPFDRIGKAVHVVVTPDSVGGEERYVGKIPDAIVRDPGHARLPRRLGVSLATASHHQICRRNAGCAPAWPTAARATVVRMVRIVAPGCFHKNRWGHNPPNSPRKSPGPNPRTSRSTGSPECTRGPNRRWRCWWNPNMYWSCPGTCRRNRFLRRRRCRA